MGFLKIAYNVNDISDNDIQNDNDINTWVLTNLYNHLFVSKNASLKSIKEHWLFTTLYINISNLYDRQKTLACYGKVNYYLS